ncbi:MAG TPA: tripartite tricarboxylate transporter substrate binding protein [Eoetvoesiella sp.]
MNSHVFCFAIRAISVAVLGLASAIASAQGYPTKPIHLVVPFPPGGSVDLAARLIEPQLSKELGQPVIIENRPGAGGGIGTRAVAQADPDGHTLLVTVVGSVSIAPSLYKDIGYTANDFAPISQIFSTPLFVMVRDDSKYKTLQSLIDAGANGKKDLPMFGSAGNGALSHLSGIMLNTAAHTGFEHIPYKGGGPMTMALLAGETDFSMLASSDALSHVRAGKLRPLAALTAERTEPLPNVPTALEQGVKGMAFNVWYGLLAPAKTPAAIVDRLNSVMSKILQEPSMVSRISATGAVPSGKNNTPAAFKKMIADETIMYAEAIRVSGAVVN